MSKDQKKICLYCKWWTVHEMYSDSDDIPPEGLPGICNYNPPVVVQFTSMTGAMDHRTVLPNARGGWFCSKFQNRSDDHEGPEHISKVADRVLERIKPKSGEDAS